MDKAQPDKTEGVGGSLTVYDTEESPLSKMQVVRCKPKAREGQLCNRNELGQAYDDPEEVRFPEPSWNEQLRRSKSKQVRMASTGPGRMHS
tara:strand:- start:12 stop:284 length:273 start_codon:yes stop_codon:yes gene_type:complete